MTQANSRKMKAAVCYEVDAPLTVEEVHLEPPGADEVQLAIKACAICHSDISAFHGHWAYEAPMIAGHEASGVIEALGANVSGFAVGDRVIVSLLWSCQQCRHCLEGEPYLCIGDYPLERHSKLANREGTRLNRAFRVAGFAQYAVVHKTQIVRAPDSMTMAAASLLACGVITGLGAVVNTAQFKFGRSVAVIGCGGVGLNAVQGARLAGATQIIAVDIEPYKLEAAQSFGATHVVNARQTDAVAAVTARFHFDHVCKMFIMQVTTHHPVLVEKHKFLVPMCCYCCHWFLQVFRHGDRSPVGTFPNDHYTNYWPQGFGQLSKVWQ